MWARAARPYVNGHARLAGLDLLRLPARDYLDVLQELHRREVEEQMRNQQGTNLLAALGRQLKKPLPSTSRAVTDDLLTPTVRGVARKPQGAAAAAAQDAWNTL